MSLQHPSAMLDNDSLAVGLVASNGTGTNLAVWIHDDSGLTKHDVANHTDLNTQLGFGGSHQRFPRFRP